MQVKQYLITLLSLCAPVHATTLLLDSITMLHKEQRIVLHQQESISVKKILNGLAQQLGTRWQTNNCMHQHTSLDTKRCMINDGTTSVYICIGCYQAPRLTITLMRHETEPQDIQLSRGFLIPQQSAHKTVKKNNLLMQTLTAALEAHAQRHYYVVQSPLVAPIKQLMGLIIPAIYIDIGLHAEQDIPCAVQVLADTIAHTITNIYEH